jgi:hypothetical protein
VSETWSRKVLYLAGASNIIGGASHSPIRHDISGKCIAVPCHSTTRFKRSSFGPPGLTSLHGALATSWPDGLALPGGAVLVAGGAGKLAYFGASLPIFLSGRGRTMLLATGILDVIFAAFFAHVLWLRRPGKPAVG